MPSASEALQRTDEELAASAEALLALPALRWLAEPAGSTESRAAAKLGGVLASFYGDPWFVDASREELDPMARRTTEFLASAAEANLRGDPETALLLLSRAGDGSSPVLKERMEYERIYALHRSLQITSCRDAAVRSADRLRASPYGWLRGQIAIESAVCTALSGKEGEALSGLRQVEHELESSPFRDLRMRAIGIRADVQTNSGDPWAAWPAAEAVMGRWWQGPFAWNRAHQVLFTESRACEYLRYPFAAAVLGKAAMDALDETPNLLTRADGHIHVASLYLSAGEREDAKAELRLAQQIFDRLTPSDTLRQYQLDADIELAAAEVAGGEAAQALRRLDETRGAFPEAPTFQLELRRSRVFGEAYAAARDVDQGDPFLRKAIAEVWDRVRQMPSAADRAAALAEAEGVFRSLVELDLAGGRETEAFALWRSFRAGRENGVCGGRVGNRLIFAQLSDSYAAWLEQPEGRFLFRTAASRTEIDRAGARLLSLVADPSSNQSDIRRESAWLYAQLVAPAAARLREQPLFVVPDGAVSAIPFGLLRAPGGELLGDRFALVSGSNLCADEIPAPWEELRSALVIGQPSQGPALSGRFPYLADGMAEAQWVARQAPAASGLYGPEASLAGLESWKAIPELFHFSGHGFSNAGHGALVLASGPDGTPALLTAERIARMDFTHCRLAVLSACLTASGELRGPSDPASLVRSLLLSGAREVVASRWSVDAGATRRLMELFYTELARRSATPDALETAMRQMRAEPRYAHPFYWGAFQVFR